MATRKGRKPLGEGHVDQLDGSELAKQRMVVLLQSLRGAITVPEACQQLSISAARFHALRNQWLQESVSLLEPRRVGRPPKNREPSPEGELLAKVKSLEEQLVVSRAQREVAEILNVASPVVSPPRGGKKREPNSKRNRRQNRRRAR